MRSKGKLFLTLIFGTPQTQSACTDKKILIRLLTLRQSYKTSILTREELRPQRSFGRVMRFHICSGGGHPSEFVRFFKSLLPIAGSSTRTTERNKPYVRDDAHYEQLARRQIVMLEAQQRISDVDFALNVCAEDVSFCRHHHAVKLASRQLPQRHYLRIKRQMRQCAIHSPI